MLLEGVLKLVYCHIVPNEVVYLKVHVFCLPPVRVKELRGGERQVVSTESPPLDAEPSAHVHGDPDLLYV